MHSDHAPPIPDRAAGPAEPAPATDRTEQLLARLEEILAAVARPPATDKLAVDLAEAAALLSCSPKTVKRMADAGELPGVLRIRRRVLVSVVALKEWIARGCPLTQQGDERSRRRV